MEQEDLDIQSPIVFDDSIAHYEVHAHQPYTSLTFNNNDEIRIAIQHQDLCLYPCKSTLHITGRITKPDDSALAHTTLINNAIGHLFDEIRYEINAIEIDKCKNVGITMLMKGLASLTRNEERYLENAGLIPSYIEYSVISNDNGNFDVSIPLSIILGFAEDYRKIIVNAKHELILTRSRSDLNAVVQTAIDAAAAPPNYEDFKITLTKIEWLMPYIIMSDKHKIQLYNHIKKDVPIAMSFRSWELYEYPMLPTTSKHVWTVKTSNQLEKPRFVILAFQTNRRDSKTANASKFDHCNISNIKLFLNSQSYPYGNLNLDIANNQYALMYEMYGNFQNAYYNNRYKTVDPLFNKREFITNFPSFIIDCSKQNENIKQAAVDVRLEFEARNNIPANTTAYCLILHDRIVHYNPISGDVRKIV